MIVPGYRLHSMEWDKEKADWLKRQLMKMSSYVEDVIVSDKLEVLVKYKPAAFITIEEAEQGFLEMWGKCPTLDPEKFPMLVDDFRRRYGDFVTDPILEKRHVS